MITTKKLAATVGAEVVGVDLDRLTSDRSLPTDCMEALEEHGVLLFRGLHIDDESQVAFSQQLDGVGKTEPAVAPKIFRVTLDPAKNPAAEYLRGTFDWHIDGATDDVPTKATILSAHVVAASGGETEFVSTYGAYEDLSDEERVRYRRTRVLHTFEASQRLVTPDPTPEELARWREKTPREHPLVWRHRSGRHSLVLGATAEAVIGMDPEQGRTLLAQLLERATTNDRVYRHDWAVGDMVIWDNCGVMHRACPYDPASPRDMHRTTLSGDEAIE